MASVHKQPRSPFYFAHYRIPIGRSQSGEILWKLIKRTTKKKKFDEAIVVAKEFENLARQQAGASTESERKYVQILREAVEHATSGLLNVSVATDHLYRLSEAANGKPLISYTIESWLRFWLDSKASAQRSNGTMVRYQGVVEDFLSTLPSERKTAPLGSIGVEDIMRFQQASAGKASATMNLAIKTLSMAFNRATELGFLKLNPTKGFDRVQTVSITKDVFSAEQVAKLVAVAQGDWKGVILFGFFTGMRLRDITALRWGNIAEEPQRIEFVAAKTGQEVKIPLHPRLTEFLKLKGKRQPPNIPIFSLLFGKMTGGYSGMSMAFSRIMATAGIEGKKVEATGAKGRARSTLSFHSLRHSFTSALANAGVAQELRQKLTGHRDSKTHQGYTHVELAKLKEAIDLLPTV